MPACSRCTQPTRAFRLGHVDRFAVFASVVTAASTSWFSSLARAASCGGGTARPRACRSAANAKDAIRPQAKCAAARAGVRLGGLLGCRAAKCLRFQEVVCVQIKPATARSPPAPASPFRQATSMACRVCFELALRRRARALARRARHACAPASCAAARAGVGPACSPGLLLLDLGRFI